MMPRDARLSDSCTPDRCCFFRVFLFDPNKITVEKAEIKYTAINIFLNIVKLNLTWNVITLSSLILHQTEFFFIVISIKIVQSKFGLI